MSDTFNVQIDSDMEQFAAYQASKAPKSMHDYEFISAVASCCISTFVKSKHPEIFELIRNGVIVTVSSLYVQENQNTTYLVPPKGRLSYVFYFLVKLTRNKDENNKNIFVSGDVLGFIFSNTFNLNKMKEVSFSEFQDLEKLPESLEKLLTNPIISGKLKTTTFVYPKKS